MSSLGSVSSVGPSFRSSADVMQVCASSMTAFKFFKAARTVLAAAAVAGAAALLAYAVLRAQMASAVQLTAGARAVSLDY